MEGRFNAPIVSLLAKRAAWHCSNPGCGILTVGPTAEEDSSTNLGEAAHIYGARPGSARFRQEMTDAERSEVSNGIWLCCSCHKRVDDDPVAHPAELLFEWRRRHERAMGLQVGQRLAAKVQDRMLAAYPEAGYLAEQIILDRPAGWEIKLAAELLLHLFAPARRRVRNITEGLYALRPTPITDDDFASWFQGKTYEITQQIHVLKNLVEKELPYAWADIGKAGSVEDIYNAAVLIRDAVDRLLDFEETVRFVRISRRFEKASDLLKGLALPQVAEVFRIPVFIQGLFANGNPTGTHCFEITFTLPDRWADLVGEAFRYASRHR